MKTQLEDAHPLARALLDSLCEVQIERRAPGARPARLADRTDPEVIKSLIKTLSEVQTLATHLACHRHAYEMDNVRLGDPFDEKTMDYAPQTDIDEGSVVSCVISRGWVRKEYKGAPEILARICKARVLLRLPGT